MDYTLPRVIQVVKSEVFLTKRIHCKTSYSHLNGKNLVQTENPSKRDGLDQLEHV